MILKENLLENRRNKFKKVQSSSLVTKLEKGIGLKMIFIALVEIIIYFILIAWTWQSLGFMEKTKKVAFILIGIILMYIITWIVFQIAKNGIVYQSAEIQGKVRNILVLIFTGINGIIVMPQIAKIWDKIAENQLEREKIGKRIVILIVIFLLCLIFESGYMRDTQEGILRMYQAMIGE